MAKAKKYEHVTLYKDAFNTLKDFPIETEELVCGQIPLGKILNTKSIKANSVTCNCTYERFDYLIGIIGFVLVLDLL